MYRVPDRIEIKSADQIALMRRAGLVVARALHEMSAAAAPGVSTGELDSIARDVLKDEGAASSFLHYDIGNGPYPAVICASVNDRIVHGIPSTTEVLADGDVISLDFGAIVDGWHGDAAVTVLIGEVDDESRGLSAACERSLWDGLAAVRAGGRLSDISHAVEILGTELRQVRDRRRLRRARHRLAHAHGSAHPQLRPGRQRPAPAAGHGPGDRTDAHARLARDARARRRLDGQHGRRLASCALGAHCGHPG